LYASSGGGDGKPGEEPGVRYHLLNALASRETVNKRLDVGVELSEVRGDKGLDESDIDESDKLHRKHSCFRPRRSALEV
jgi:hypothetical protein